MNAGAQARNLQVRPAAGWIWRLGTKVGMEVLIVCLEQAQPEVATEERQSVIHTTADGQCRAIGVRLVVGATQPDKPGVCMNERRNLRGRVAENHTQLSGRGSVIVPVGMIGIFELPTDVAVEEVAHATNRAVVDGRVRNRATDANVGAGRNRNRAMRREIRVA